jgi:hypothetical protein
MSKKTYFIIIAGWTFLSISLSFFDSNLLILILLLIILGPVLREFSVIIEKDERERYIYLRSSHFALISVYAVILIYFIFSILVKHKNPDPEWYLVLIVPLLIKWCTSLGSTKGIYRLGLSLSLFFGSAWTLFSVLSHGLSLVSLIDSAIGLSILIPALLALKWPKTGAVLLMLTGIVLVFVLLRSNRNPNIFKSLLMLVCLPAPPFFGGMMIFRSIFKSFDDEFKSFRKEEFNENL